MRGLGDFQRAQMRRSDPRVSLFFQHLREAIDLLERFALDQIALALSEKPSAAKQEPVNVELALKTPDANRLAYTVREVCRNTSVSRSTLYQSLADKKLRAVKCGGRTLILTKDLQEWIDSWPPR